MCVSATIPSNHVEFFFPPFAVFSHTCTDKWSAEYSRRILCLSLEFSHCVACSCVACPLDPPGLSVLSPQFREIPRLYLGDPPLNYIRGTLKEVRWGHLRPHFLFFLDPSERDPLLLLSILLSHYEFDLFFFFFFRFHLWDQTLFLFLCLACFI